MPAYAQDNGIPVRTVYRRVSQGHLDSVRVGKAVRIVMSKPAVAPLAYYRPEDVAEILGLNIHTIYRALARGEIPYIRSPYYHIPCQWLGMEPPRPIGVPRDRPEDYGQLVLPIGPVVPSRLWRNAVDGRRLPIAAHTYDQRLYGFGGFSRLSPSNMV